MSVRDFAVTSVRCAAVFHATTAIGIPVGSWNVRPSGKMGRSRREGGRC